MIVFLLFIVWSVFYVLNDSGVAHAIVKAGGEVIQKESEKHINKHGKVKVSQTVTTGAGYLHSKYVSIAHYA